MYERPAIETSRTTSRSSGSPDEYRVEGGEQEEIGRVPGSRSREQAGEQSEIDAAVVQVPINPAANL